MSPPLNVKIFSHLGMLWTQVSVFLFTKFLEAEIAFHGQAGF